MFITFSSNLSDITEVNPSFDAAKLRIAYTGRNRNNSFISKEAFERAIPTMFNCPVVANYMREENEIGSHDGEFVKDADGNTTYVNLTQPVGVVPESATYNWETVTDNGVIHQYLCTDVLLWKRQEAYKKIKENGVTEQSMEITVTDGEMTDDYYNIKDFCFTAFCLLGTAEPCFESAALFTFSQDDFVQQYTEMIKELKAELDTAKDTTEKEGKRDFMLKELLEKYQVTEDQLEFEYADLSDEELEAKFIEQFESDGGESDGEGETGEPAEPAESEVEPEPETPEDNPESDSEDDGDTDDSGEPETDDFALNSNIRESLYDAVSAAKVETDWGSYSRYWMVDFDIDAKEVYFYDNEDGKLYGSAFRADGDDIVVDFENITRKKYAIVDYIEGDIQEFALPNLIEQFNTAYANAAVDKAEMERLQEFERETLAERRTEAESELFGKFEEQLNEMDEFEALKSNAGEYTLEDLEKELFVLVGKRNFNFSTQEAGEATKPMVGIPTRDDDNAGAEEFGGLFSWKKNEENN